MTDVLEALRWRYAVKKFDNERSLSKQQIDRLKEAFNLTATSFGLQPVKLVVVEDKRFRESLLPHSYHQQQVVDASHVLVFCVHDTFDAAYVRNYFNQVKAIRNTPDAILKDYQNYLLNWVETTSTEEKHLWAVKQAYLTMGNLLTVCALEGIDACPMEGFVPASYDELLELKEKGLKSALVMPVGYRAADDMFADFKKVRKDLVDAVLHVS